MPDMSTTEIRSSLAKMAKGWLDEYIKNTGIEANVCAYDIAMFLISLDEAQARAALKEPKA